MQPQKNEKKHVIIQCYHCGNKGLMNIVKTVKEKFGSIYETDDGYIERDFQENYIWQILSCPVCRFISIFQVYTDESLVTYNSSGDASQLYEKEIIYPENKLNLKNVPSEITSAFDAALKIKRINREICLISLRRTLELICKEKKAKGENLHQKIMFLIREKVFPKELEDAYYVIKEFGNDGAHELKVVLNDYEVDEVINLLYDVINYLYVMPQKMKILKQKLNARKKNKEKELLND